LLITYSATKIVTLSLISKKKIQTKVKRGSWAFAAGCDLIYVRDYGLFLKIFVENAPIFKIKP
jgi:hypothetical protein